MNHRQSSREEDTGKGHRRIHSRNLSVHFPRPLASPNIQSTIAEDSDAGDAHEAEGQELEIKSKPFGSGFKFGAAGKQEPPDSADRPSPPLLTGDSTKSRANRRGHHHKHSISHNFFSFLEAGGIQSSSLHTQPIQTPVSPWTPMSGFTPSTNSTFAAKQELSIPRPRPNASRFATLAACVQATLGAILWVKGQQAPSLSTTALGYWVVFDAFGLAISSGLALRLMGSSSPTEQNIRKPFGNARVEALLLFSQVVYLMFAAVYVCKETVEHLLLSSGGGITAGDGHHHHPRDEEVEQGSPIQFPVFLIFLTFISLLWTGIGFENHAKLVSITNTRIPLSFSKLIAAIAPTSSRSSYLRSTTLDHGEQWAAALTNPYLALPLLISASLLFSAMALPPSTQHTADLFMAAGIAFLTGDLAYRACAILGTVLLQTSPPRSKPSRSASNSAALPSLGDGKMEKFLRVMRDVERHPHILHLPAPHIWQVSPLAVEGASRISHNSELVVTLELHVRPELSDEDALDLTRWVWERCMQALGVPGALNLARQGEEDVGAQITVGVVRG